MRRKVRKLTPKQIELRRIKGGILLKVGRLSQGEIARRLGVTASAVMQWAHTLRTQGLMGLQRKALPGRQPRLTMENWQHVLTLLRRGALAAGWNTNRWTPHRIHALIQRTFGVQYNLKYLSGRINRLGFSCLPNAQRVLKCQARA